MNKKEYAKVAVSIKFVPRWRYDENFSVSRIHLQLYTIYTIDIGKIINMLPKPHPRTSYYSPMIIQNEIKLNFPFLLL